MLFCPRRRRDTHADRSVMGVRYPGARVRAFSSRYFGGYGGSRGHNIYTFVQAGAQPIRTYCSSSHQGGRVLSVSTHAAIAKRLTIRSSGPLRCRAVT